MRQEQAVCRHHMEAVHMVFSKGLCEWVAGRACPPGFFWGGGAPNNFSNELKGLG